MQILKHFMAQTYEKTNAKPLHIGSSLNHCCLHLSALNSFDIITILITIACSELHTWSIFIARYSHTPTPRESYLEDHVYFSHYFITVIVLLYEWEFWLLLSIKGNHTVCIQALRELGSLLVTGWPKPTTTEKTHCLMTSLWLQALAGSLVTDQFYPICSHARDVCQHWRLYLCMGWAGGVWMRVCPLLDRPKFF